MGVVYLLVVGFLIKHVVEVKLMVFDVFCQVDFLPTAYANLK
jgi:hypothetical protein